MWVVLLNFFAKTSTLRITPTYVGSTNPKYREKQGRQDHPHVCGQYYIMFIYLEANRGSPPRMWVVLDVYDSSSRGIRITPTYVGSTLMYLYSLMKIQDHPHVCGQYSFYIIFVCLLAGSPPRMWVVHLLLHPCLHTCRITPTYVGSTSPRKISSARAWDHPHVCGQYGNCDFKR